jgi:hypothetical protein
MLTQMTVDFPDGVLRRLHDSWRDKLNQAYGRLGFCSRLEWRAVPPNALIVEFFDLHIRRRKDSESAPGLADEVVLMRLYIRFHARVVSRAALAGAGDRGCRRQART